MQLNLLSRSALLSTNQFGADSPHKAVDFSLIFSVKLHAYARNESSLLSYDVYPVDGDLQTPTIQVDTTVEN